MNTAIISPCGTYRYTLTRRIPQAIRWVKPCLFVMLNPSIADATQDDPTIRRCISFAKREGCTSLTVVNLFAMRATDPKQLTAAMKLGQDPIGPDNCEHVIQQIAAHSLGIIVAAWGAHRLAITMPVQRHALHEAGAHCLGMTKDGSPKHPLYVRADQPLVPWVDA